LYFAYDKKVVGVFYYFVRRFIVALVDVNAATIEGTVCRLCTHSYCGSAEY
jgi:hypothetical protein